MFQNIPPLTRTVLFINVLVFLAMGVFGNGLINTFALWPWSTLPEYGDAPGFQVWQIITYSFLHGSFTHLFFNMFALYLFGSELERLFGERRFFQLYFASVIAAALAQLVFSAAMGGEPYTTVGASGGVFGLLLAFAWCFPNRQIVLLIPPIPMPAWLFVTLYGGLELILGVTGTQEGVAHFAHLGGMLGAWILLRYWRRRNWR